MKLGSFSITAVIGEYKITYKSQYFKFLDEKGFLEWEDQLKKWEDQELSSMLFLVELHNHRRLGTVQVFKT